MLGKFLLGFPQQNHAISNVRAAEVGPFCKIFLDESQSVEQVIRIPLIRRYGEWNSGGQRFLLATDNGCAEPKIRTQSRDLLE